MQASQENFRFYVFTEWKNNAKAIDIYNKLRHAWNDQAPALSTIHRLIVAYRKGQGSLKDRPRSGRPRSSVTPATIETVRASITANSHQSLRDLANETDLSIKSVHNILRHELKLRNVCSVWIPHLLSDAQKQSRVNSAINIRRTLQNLQDLKSSRYAVEDETWINFIPTYTKAENRVWIPRDQKRPQVVRPSLTPKKTMLILAFTANKKFSIKTLPYGETLDSQGYIQFLQNTYNKWRCLRTDPIKPADLFWQHDNARPHVSKETKTFLTRKKVKMLFQAPHSPDLNLCDRFLFPLLKKELRKNTYRNHLEVQNKVQDILKHLPRTFLEHELVKLINHCEQVINMNGEYITK